MALQPKTGLAVRIPETSATHFAGTASTRSQATEPLSPNSTRTLSFSSPASYHPLGRPPSSSRQQWSLGLFPDKQTCNLCKRDFSDTNGNIVRELPCGDIFHRTCVDLFLGEPEGNCPSCLLPIPDEWYARLPLVYEDDELAKKVVFKEDVPKRPNVVSRGLRKCRKRARNVVTVATRPFVPRPKHKYTKTWAQNVSRETIRRMEETEGSSQEHAGPLGKARQRFMLD